MDKEDKQIIDRATKENWRIGDRTRLKHLLEKNLKLYRENVKLENKIADIKANCDLAIEGRAVKIMELEKENAELKERYDKVDIIGYDALKNLTKAKEIIKGLLSCCRNYPQENAEKIKQAEQFLRETDIDNAIQKVNEGLNLDKIAEEVENDLKEGCPDVLCEGCNKEDCIARKLGLIC